MGKEKITDADGNVHVGISKYPFIVLKATGDEIKQIIKNAKSNGIFVVDYPQAMFDTGPDEELVEALSKVHETEIKYHAALLLGDIDVVKTLTAHLKLYK